MSARRVAALTLGLPPSSRFMRAVAGGSGWTLDQTLAGLAVERLDTLVATYVKAHGGKVGKMPTIVPRPKPQRPEARPVGEFLAGLDRAIAGGEG